LTKQLERGKSFTFGSIRLISGYLLTATSTSLKRFSRMRRNYVTKAKSRSARSRTPCKVHPES